MIRIDRAKYAVTKRHMTGAELRYLPTPALSDDLDLWKQEPGDDDRLIGNDDVLEIGPWLRLFTVPKMINGG